MSLLRFKSLVAGPGRLFFPSFCLFFSTALIGAVPMTYLLVPLLMVFLILSMLVVVEVVRDTSAPSAVAPPPVQVELVELVPVVACQMLRSARGKQNGKEVFSVRV